MVSGIYASGKTAATVNNNLFYGSGMSCWFQNKDMIQQNSFLGPRQFDVPHALTGGVQILGASQPTIRQNLFAGCETAILFSDIKSDSPNAKSTGNATIEKNAFSNNEQAVGQREEQTTQALPLPEGNLQASPEFQDPAEMRKLRNEKYVSRTI